MNRHAHSVLGAALAFMLGCTGGSGAAIDTDFWQDAAVDGSVVCHCSCNPVTQSGCETGEKCGTLVESIDPFLARMTCVPDGSVGLGGACVRAAASAAMGYDDCIAGLDCLGGICANICGTGTPDSCRNEFEAFGEGEYCTQPNHIFNQGIGVCTPGCNPLDDLVSNGTVASSDCNAEQSCALDALFSSPVCMDTSPQAQLATQNKPCSNSNFSCHCASGFTSLLPNTPENSNGSSCARYCSPVDTYAGNDAKAQGDADRCSDANLALVGGAGVESSDHQCRFIQSFDDGNEHLPAVLGMCVPTTPVSGGTWGDCRILDWDGIKNAWNSAVADGTDPNTALNNYCRVSPDNPLVIKDICIGLFRGCVSLAKKEAALN